MNEDQLESLLQLHAGGKIAVMMRSPIETPQQLAQVYTPGFAHVARVINEQPERAYELSAKGNLVAIVSDGTAVSGLGDLGPLAVLPILEGKAMLFRRFASINAVPICLNTTDPDEIVRTIATIAPTFGAIMLEDISAPRCFDIEDRLSRMLDIPVCHDDQHGTAVAVTAALINALRIVRKRPEDLKVVLVGVGAAGTASAKMFRNLGVTNIIGCDRQGAIGKHRQHLGPAKQWFAENGNPNNETGTLRELLVGADVFVGVSGPGLIDRSDIDAMAPDPIVFALANPVPEITPEDAGPNVAVIATGRSAFPNQVDCGLCYPGLFRGALDCRAVSINAEMKVAAAYAIAGAIPESKLAPDYVVPSIFEEGLHASVARAVVEAAERSGVARMPVKVG